MTTTELRDYIAINAMSALITNEHMALEKLAALSSTMDDDSLELATTITQAAYNIAEEMMLEKAERDKGMRRATFEEMNKEKLDKEIDKEVDQA